MNGKGLLLCLFNGDVTDCPRLCTARGAMEKVRYTFNSVSTLLGFGSSEEGQGGKSNDGSRASNFKEMLDFAKVSQIFGSHVT